MDTFSTWQHAFHKTASVLPPLTHHARDWAKHPMNGQQALPLASAGHAEASPLDDCEHGVIRATCTRCAS